MDYWAKEIPNVTVPEGISGGWTVKRFEVTEETAKFSRLRAAIGHSREYVDAGWYTKLCNPYGTIVMSDTLAEKDDHAHAVAIAYGQVLITGLGLGVVTQACLLKPDVKKVTVIELEQDVINLVAPHYQSMFGDRIEIFCANAYTWPIPKGSKYDTAWHDIWNHICGDNWEDMKRLKRHYQRHVKWQGCWCEVETRRRVYN
jgi:hypothetical protein